ncbi:hypothetical protein BDP67DRAFT_294148 [Colletotrichum lupini]|nr:hypothetical protein BDP67DRAFT_294148 [Colletotrichum lupini]
MRFFYLLPLFASAAIAADQGKGCGTVDAIDCSGNNIVKCYTFPGRSGLTWNYVDSCADRGQVCRSGACDTIPISANQGKGCDLKNAFGCSGNNIVQCYTFPGRNEMTWNYVRNQALHRIVPIELTRLCSINHVRIKAKFVAAMFAKLAKYLGIG